jgi:ribonucleoside-triphosphate reductase
VGRISKSEFWEKAVQDIHNATNGDKNVLKVWMDLPYEWAKSKGDFALNYVNSANNADASDVDPNANIEIKTAAAMGMEMYKAEHVQYQRYVHFRRIENLFGMPTAKQFLEDLEDKIIYVHDSSSSAILPYCAAVTINPLFTEGLKKVGCPTKIVKHLSSLAGALENFVYALAGNYAGAIATVEALYAFDFFARKDYGANYLDNKKIRRKIEQTLQSIIYSINSSSVSPRTDQSVFWNISVFDKQYSEHLLENPFDPDKVGKVPFRLADFIHYKLNGIDPYGLNKRSLMKLQNFFLEWFRLEREKEILTFPVVTAAYTYEKKPTAEQKRKFIKFFNKAFHYDLKEEQCPRIPRDFNFFRDICFELSKGSSFFTYRSPDVDSLASCCRLRSSLADNQFSYTLGGTAVQSGSIKVITLNLNRIVQVAAQEKRDYMQDLSSIIDRVHKYLIAFKDVIYDYLDAHMLPAYDIGAIHIDRQFLTVGLNGAVEAAEFLGIKPDNNPEYKKFLKNICETFKNKNKEARTTYKDLVSSKGRNYKLLINTEFVPAENLGVKNAKWDKKDGFESHRICHNSYFYPSENEWWNKKTRKMEPLESDIFDKLDLYGEEVTDCLDGGSACHLYLEHQMAPVQYALIELYAMKVGAPYIGYNLPARCCEDCGYNDFNSGMQKGRSAEKSISLLERIKNACVYIRTSNMNEEKKDDGVIRCRRCGSANITWAERIIGYLKKIDHYSKERQAEFWKRFRKNNQEQGESK